MRDGGVCDAVYARGLMGVFEERVGASCTVWKVHTCMRQGGRGGPRRMPQKRQKGASSIPPGERKSVSGAPPPPPTLPLVPPPPPPLLLAPPLSWGRSVGACSYLLRCSKEKGGGHQGDERVRARVLQTQNTFHKSICKNQPPPLHGSVPPLIPPPHLLSHTRHCQTQSPPHTRMVLEQRGSSKTREESDTAPSDGPASSAVPPVTSIAVPPAVPPPPPLHWVLLALCRGPPITANRGRAAAEVTFSPPSPPSEPPPPSVPTVAAGGEGPQGRCSLQGPLLRPTGGTSPAAAHTSMRGECTRGGGGGAEIV